ncbi:hypothetical protein NOR51B_743 [Luminiphilus syltensis NOR5-1B]|uniref:Phosphoheptose isomerase n=1 Tax=Luminiphilus syltensis NOR5-1B TaxID=565045 RepID=B8KR64_9GAMM|nr:hypothetical protein [Luminiphilus syltensis]EED34804.1 hypothetical protein NOR51B_743 [Luminiphilus syltensis NOR5-1B]
MNHYDQIARHFESHIGALSLSVDIIAEVIGHAADNAAEAIFTEQKLFSCGIGADGANAILLSELLQRGVFRERPALPVIELVARHSVNASDGASWVSHQLQSLGQPGDMAIIFASGLPASGVQEISGALAARDIAGVWIGNSGKGIELTFPETSAATALALSSASAIALAELIDITAFGPLEG